MDRGEFILTNENIGVRGAAVKDPDVILDYCVDWSSWLSRHGESVDHFEWELPDGLDAEAEFSTKSRSTVWLSGGSVGTSYLVMNVITTRRGRTKSFGLSLVCRHK